uniref:Uncharacterized protein n=1 Tax=Pipistrellus kuhlii TaxID=59472 RepID=A0A7J7RMW8_PIPKU|nr:hypothetical protein mPipKuh1_010397 [Pipistrellus kuhlii]
MMKENHGLAASCTPPTEDQAHDPGLCPDWESNRDLLVHRFEAQMLSHTGQPIRFILISKCGHRLHYPILCSPDPSFTTHSFGEPGRQELPKCERGGVLVKRDLWKQVVQRSPNIAAFEEGNLGPLITFQNTRIS